MKKLLKHYLRKYPTIYQLAKGIYGILYHIGMSGIRPLLGTRLEERYWANRPSSVGVEYWNMKNHPHRNFLIEHISTFAPVRSILEVGCNSGPNLYLLAKKFPNAELRGIDINSHTVEYGNTQFKQEGISNVKLSIGKADVLESFQDNCFDIVFTDAVLIYVGRDKIKKAIKQLLRITCRALILMEWHCFESKSNPLGYYTSHWVRDYAALLRMFVSEEKIRIVKMPEELWPDKNWQKYGGLAIAEK